MKKQLFCILFLLVVFSVSAQRNYAYLYGQDSPFNGVFLEPRYYNIDSIVYETYGYYSVTSSEGFREKLANINEIRSFEEPPSGYNHYFKSYTLLSKNNDGLVDTLRTYAPEHAGESYAWQSVKKYTVDDQLIYVCESNQSYTNEVTYTYDLKGRILIEKQKNFIYETDTIVKDSSYVEYDYEKGVIYTKPSNIYFEYTNNGYMIADTFNVYESIPGGLSGEVKCVDKKTYIFDSKNRLETIDIERTLSSPIFYPTPVVTKGKYNYKYTDFGYEEYFNSELNQKVTFQEDGYCSEVILYFDSVGEMLRVFSIKRFSYFNSGQEVSNREIELIIPKAYGVDGGVIIELTKSAAISVYTLSGSLVKKTNVDEGNTMMPLTKGIYIVVIGDLSYKVLVR